MKTNFLILLSVLASMAANAFEKDEINYVVTNEDTIICKDISVGFTNAKITKTNGDVVKVNKENVEAYKVDGKIYEKKVVFKNKKATDNKDYMELIAERNGLKLYCYKFIAGSGWDTNKGNYENSKEIATLLVYKDNNLFVEVEKKNAPTILDFFHVAGVQFE
jgi:hypothetical protein